MATNARLHDDIVAMLFALASLLKRVSNVIKALLAMLSWVYETHRYKKSSRARALTFEGRRGDWMQKCKTVCGLSWEKHTYSNRLLKAKDDDESLLNAMFSLGQK